jgi:hypothetical protein
MFQIDAENYEECKGALENLFALLKDVKKITLKGIDYNIKFFVGGDWKHLAIMFGLKAASSSHPCIWCTCEIKKCLDTSTEWPICRTHIESEIFYPKEELGYKFKPLINFVEFDCIVIDTLHLFLRVTDKLFKILVNELNTADSNEDKDLDKRPMLKIYLDFLEKKVNLTRPYYQKRDEVTGKTAVILRNLNGNERLKVFKILFENGKDFSDIFQSSSIDFTTLSSVFIKFMNTFETLKNFNADDFTMQKVESLKNDLLEWLEWFQLLNTDGEITPYIHAFTMHTPELLILHKNINLFNVQGLEKLNDITTKIYHKNTNKQKTDKKYLTQLLNKRNRMEFYNLGGSLKDLKDKFDILMDSIDEDIENLSDEFETNNSDSDFDNDDTEEYFLF